MSFPKGCDQCRKASLSLLLLRPSPVAHARALRTDNVSSIISAPTLTKGLLPSRLPSDSRFVLRLLRAGYVHVYIPNPPPTLRKNWLTFRVTDDADLISEDRPMFSQPNANIQCVRKDHNRAGMKVLTIPHAHQISEIWIAFSANLWNSTIRTRNAANPAAMQRIALSGDSDNTFSPTVEALESHVLECKLTKRAALGWEKPLFPYHELFRNNGTQELAEYLAAVARAHPKTQRKERAVILADPVGVTAELNMLRQRRYSLLCRELEKPEYQHALKSASAIDGLRKSIEKSNEQIATTTVSKRLTKLEFDSRDWPPGTEWFELDNESKALLPKAMMPINRSGTYIQHKMRHAERMGMVRYADHDARAKRWAKEQSEKTWADFTPYIDQEARAQWFSKFNAMLKEKHEESLDRLELDWSTACNDEKTVAYFVNHFDPLDPNDPKLTHSPGAAYSRENALIRTPGPHTNGRVLDEYLAQLEANINDERAVMLRSIVGNQHEFIAAVHQQLTADPGDGMRDKVFDILKDLKVVKKYSWLADGVGLFGYGQLCAVSAALLSMATRANFNTVYFGNLCLKNQLLWGVQQATEYLRKAQLHAALSGNMPNRPVMIVAQIPAALALEINTKLATQLNGISPRDLERLRSHQEKIPVTLMTDTDTVRSGRLSMREMLLRDHARTAQIGPATHAAQQAAQDADHLVASHKQILLLAREQISAGTRAAAHIGQFLSGPTTSVLDSVVNGIDGRLAIGGLVVQALGFSNSVAAYQKNVNSSDAQERFEAQLGLLDSAIGLTAAMVQLTGVGVEAFSEAKHGIGSAASRLLPAAFRIGGGLFGVAGAYISSVAMREKQSGARKNHDDSAAVLYGIAEKAFMANMLASTLSIGGSIAETAVARGAAGVVVRAVAVRLGANATLVAIGGIGLSVSGIGLVLLGAGLAIQLGALALTPTALQKWFSRSYFGKNREILGFSMGNRDERFIKLIDELHALDNVLKESANSGPDNKSK